MSGYALLNKVKRIVLPPWLHALNDVTRLGRLTKPPRHIAAPAAPGLSIPLHITPGPARVLLSATLEQLPHPLSKDAHHLWTMTATATQNDE